MPVEDEDDPTLSEEFNTNPELKRGDIILLREWLGTQKHLPEVSDIMLIRFLHCCYYDLVDTKKCIESYYTMRTNAPELFKNRDLTNPELLKLKEVMYQAVVPVTDPRGYRVVYLSMRDLDPANCFPNDIFKMVFMIPDAMVHKYGNMPGVVIIYNMEGIRFSHILRCTVSLIKKATYYTQDGVPIRLKEIHVINTVSWIDKLLAILKPFLKKELLELISFHGSDLEALHDRIPKGCLPKEIGGAQASIVDLDAETTRFLTSLSDFFNKDDLIQVDKSKREKKKKKNTGDSPEIMFNKLDID